MTIVNTTFHVDDDVRDDYLEYMKRFYIPEARETGAKVICFARIDPQHETQGTSYSLQLKLDYECQRSRADGILHKLYDRFGNRVLGFQTLLEEIDC
jgi:hypothetical protein